MAGRPYADLRGGRRFGLPWVWFQEHHHAPACGGYGPGSGIEPRTRRLAGACGRLQLRELDVLALNILEVPDR